MDEREQAELQWIRQNRQREIDRAKKREQQLDDIKSLEDNFEEEFYKAIRRIKCSDKTYLKEYFEQDELISNVPVDLIANDNIDNNQDEIANIINCTYNGQWNKLKKKAEKISIEKQYVHNFAISHDSIVSIVVTRYKRKEGFTRRIWTYESNAFIDSLTVKNDLMFLKLPKPYEQIKHCNLAETTSFVPSKKLKIKKTSTKCSSILKQIQKDIVSTTKNKLNKNVNHLVSDINLLSVNIQHILCPFYIVRFHTAGFDEKFVINAQTKHCAKM